MPDPDARRKASLDEGEEAEEVGHRKWRKGVCVWDEDGREKEMGCKKIKRETKMVGGGKEEWGGRRKLGWREQKK